MDWIQVLTKIFNLCIVPILGVLTAFVVNWLKKQAEKITSTIDKEDIAHYTQIISDIINECVIATNQTYVDALKAEGAFDEAAAQEAYDKTYESVVNLLNEPTKVWLNYLYEDSEAYLKTAIEAAVKWNKEED